MPEELVVVVAGGEPDRATAYALPPGTPVIAADSGLEHAPASGDST